MAYFCIRGAGECTACGDCISASVCDICGETIRSNKKYYELSDVKVCEKCVDLAKAEEDTVCSRCGDTVKENKTVLWIWGRALCHSCSEDSEGWTDYVEF